MIKGILFDKDGTLIEFKSVWHEIIGNIFTALSDRFQVSEEMIDRLKMVSGYQEEDFLKESIIQYCATSEIVEIWYKVITEEDWKPEGITKEALMELFDEKALDEAIKIEALDGVLDVLDYLKKNHYVLGVATADTYSSTVFSLRKADLLSYFDFIGCNDGIHHPKPQKDMAVRFCEKYHLNPQEVLIVGDSISDMQFAENAGAHFLGLKTEYNDYEKFMERNKEVADHLSDILIRYHL